MKEWLPIRKSWMRGLTILFAVVFIVSGYLAFREVSARREAQKSFLELARRAQLVAPAEHEDDKPLHTHDIAALTEENDDCIGWISVSDTAVDYPVMHTPEEPQRYLRQNFSGEYSISGTPFLDGRSRAGDKNKVIFGHNMKDGSMFTGLHGYEDAAFLAEHPVIEFETSEGCTEYRVFAVLELYKDDPWYDALTLDDPGEYEKAVSEICRKALYDTGIKPAYPQELLTLSTCGGKDRDARLAVIAVKEQPQR